MRLLAILSLSLLIFSCNREKEPTLRAFMGEAFGTTYSIKMFASEELNIVKGLDSVLNRVNESVSTYIPDSDISRINRGDTTVVIDQIFKDVFLLSEEVHQNSNGYFDPTIGVLRNAYGFGDVDYLKQINQTTLDSLMQFVGFDKVEITAEGTIKKEHPQIYFDFNAVAKGYGIDLIGRYLESEGIENYLIELGGEILSKGKNLSKDKWWNAGVESIDSERGNRSATLAITMENDALASSGNYRKFRFDTLSGKKYVHTLNPLTGSAEQGDVTSASVLAKTCAEADAYATACMALGLEKTLEMLKNTSGIEVYLTYNDSLNMPKVYMSPGFEKKVLK